MIKLFLNAFSLGFALAMDAFSVSIVDGLKLKDISIKNTLKIGLTFGFFQFLMPFIGWLFVKLLIEEFKTITKYIPWIAFLLLSFLGIKMIYESFKKETEVENTSLSFKNLIIQGIATSIDALSVGFTISEYTITQTLEECLIIGIVTFILCIAAVKIGQKFGIKLKDKAEILGGIILILVGLEILLL